MARPLKDIQPWQVYKLARIGCTNVEISTILGCCDDTLVSRFSEPLKKGREKMKMSLRRMQYRAACAGDRTILIWLGKQYLGQVDKVYNINVNNLSDEQLEAIANGADPHTVASSSGSRTGTPQTGENTLVN